MARFLLVFLAFFWVFAFSCVVDGGGDDDDNTSVDDDVDNDDDSPIDIYVSSGNPYERGALTVNILEISEGEFSAPVNLLIFHPVEQGQYAVVQWQHGFLTANRWYSEILTHLASHGFIVVAPQMYKADGIPIGKPTSREEAAKAIEVLNWSNANLSTITGVTARTDFLGLAGHSRGGKVCWIILAELGYQADAVCGIDPVDAAGPIIDVDPPVADEPFNLGIPSHVFGTGLGPIPKLPMFPACAPEGYNHEQFYGASAAPVWHVVATEQGHMDMLDGDFLDDCGIICDVCTEGSDLAGMRKLTAGQMSAFFRYSLQDDETMFDYLTNPALAPIPVEMECRL